MGKEKDIPVPAAAKRHGTSGREISSVGGISPASLQELQEHTHAEKPQTQESNSSTSGKLREASFQKFKEMFIEDGFYFKDVTEKEIYSFIDFVMGKGGD